MIIIINSPHRSYLVSYLSSNIEALCSHGGEQLPRIASCITIIGIAAYQDARLSVAVRFLIDGIFFAEGSDKIPTKQQSTFSSSRQNLTE